MADSTRILASKLKAPNSKETIKREELLSAMEQSTQKRLTAIVAGTGYGKTTAVAQSMSLLGVNAVWYRLDESDGDLSTIISYLVAGIGKFYPEFGTRTIRAMAEARGLNREPLPVVLTTFLHEIEETVRQELVIVLDDYHFVRESREINEAIEILLNGLSPLVHLILISRSEPALALSRLRAMREVIDIGEEDLAFSPGDIERLYSEVFALRLNNDAVANIQRRTGGWVAGLILLCNCLKGKSSDGAEIENDFLNLRDARRSIFNYFEETVYGGLPEECKEFLTKTSVLPRFNTEFCNRLLDIDFSGDMLAYFEENHLFISSSDGAGQWYSYHPLFREFLQSRLKGELDHASLMKLHREAAALLDSGGDAEAAIEQYLISEEFDRACGLLERAGRQIFTEGRHRVLGSYIDAIPPDFLDEYPRVGYLQAQLMGLRGRHHEAMEKYNKIFNRFLERQDQAGVHNCLVELGLNRLLTGNMKQAQEVLQELLKHKKLDPALHIEALGYLGYVAAYMENMNLADRCFQRAKLIVDRLTDEDLRRECRQWVLYCKAFYYLFSDEFNEMLETAEYMKAISDTSTPNLQLVRAYFLFCMAYYHLGFYSEGYEASGKALKMIEEDARQSRGTAAEASGYHTPHVSIREERGFPETLAPWLLAYRAANAARLGKIAEAVDAVMKSRKVFRDMGCHTGEAYTYVLLHGVSMKSGDRAAAERHARSGIEAIRGLSVLRVETSLKLRLAKSLIEKGETEEALQLILAAKGRVKGARFTALANLLHARLHLLNNESREGLNRLLAALEICERRGDETVLISEKNWIVPLLVELSSQGKKREYVSEIIARMGPEAAKSLTLLQGSDSRPVRDAASHILRMLVKTSPPDLNVSMLGKFRVFLDGREIPAEKWKSRKAKTLFQFLVYSRLRGHLKKEILMELLWPEEDPVLTVKRFHVALTSLRRTLEPEISKGVLSSYIARIGDSYEIDLGEGGRVDIEDFASELRCADREHDHEKALKHLLKAESLYSGEFLAEEPYADWSFEGKEKYRKDYLNLTRQIVSHFGLRGNHAKCIEYAEKHLATDKYAEDICRLLMVSYWEIGDKSGMARTFKRCRDAVNRDLNCGISEQTERLYRGFTASPPNRSNE